uniref:Uncharacterized protein n=1 Tax=Streptomyces sp. NBC_00180 TaxID=2903632 RepID=A0AAU1I3U6_9ACTN
MLPEAEPMEMPGHVSEAMVGAVGVLREVAVAAEGVRERRGPGDGPVEVARVLPEAEPMEMPGHVSEAMVGAVGVLREVAVAAEGVSVSDVGREMAPSR